MNSRVATTILLASLLQWSLFSPARAEPEAWSVLDDFESPGFWLPDGSGPGRFEIGEPHAFPENEGECASVCFGTGAEGDNSEIGTQAACTNLDGHQQPFESMATNSLTSLPFNFLNSTNVSLDLWRFMEIEGNNFDFCYFQYRLGPGQPWTTFETFGAGGEINDDDWTPYYANLSDAADHQPYFQLRVYCITDVWTEGSGLCLDDLGLSWFGLSPSVCGNGVIERDETCDDSNLESRDGCSDRCQIELASPCTWKGCRAGAATVSVDDGYNSCWDTLDANGFLGTYFLSYTDTFTQAHWDNLSTMHAEGHEMAAHTRSHLCEELNETALRQEIESNRDDILTQIGMPPAHLTSFAWPCGITNEAMRTIASGYFIGARGYHLNMAEDSDPLDFMNIRNLNTPNFHDPGLEPPDYYLMADYAEATGKWITFTFHNECEDNGSISYLATKDLWVAPFGTVVKYIRERQAATLSNFTSSGSQITFRIASGVDPGVFDVPLTIRIWQDPWFVTSVRVNGVAQNTSGVPNGTAFSWQPSGDDFVVVSLNLCGNAVIDGGETCDDGNRAGGDGCSAICLVEPPRRRKPAMLARD